jgi:hypothetical protein
MPVAEISLILVIAQKVILSYNLSKLIFLLVQVDHKALKDVTPWGLALFMKLFKF